MPELAPVMKTLLPELLMQTRERTTGERAAFEMRARKYTG
jgi:hypothetical protein